MRFVFTDDSETTIFAGLLNNSKTNFELTFDKAKVNFFVGGGFTHRDPAKPEVSLYQSNRMLEIMVEPKQAGIIKLTSASQPRPNEPNSPPSPPNNDYTEQIRRLNARLAELESKNNQSRPIGRKLLGLNEN
jgi:hypothetical protein